MPDTCLAVELGPLKLKNPILLASGTCGYGLDMARWYPLNLPGGIVTKSLSLNPKVGAPPPRIAELPAGMLNAIGLENIGIRRFLDEKLPALIEAGATVIVSVFAESEDGFVRLVDMLNRAPGVAAIELNISCPNVHAGGMEFGMSPHMTERLLRALRPLTRLPLIAKLTPNDTNIFEVGRAAVEGGADILSLVNTFLGMSIDIEREIPRIGRIVGGYSGPGIKPIALRMVYEMVKQTQAPVIGIGGIQNVDDVLEYLYVGARAVQIGTANFVDPYVVPRILEALPHYLARKNIRDINDWIGRIRHLRDTMND